MRLLVFMPTQFVNPPMRLLTIAISYIAIRIDGFPEISIVQDIFYKIGQVPFGMN